MCVCGSRGNGCQPPRLKDAPLADLRSLITRRSFPRPNLIPLDSVKTTTTAFPFSPSALRPIKRKWGIRLFPSIGEWVQVNEMKLHKRRANESTADLLLGRSSAFREDARVACQGLWSSTPERSIEGKIEGRRQLLTSLFLVGRANLQSLSCDMLLWAC